MTIQRIGSSRLTAHRPVDYCYSAQRDRRESGENPGLTRNGMGLAA
ncbi:hypothetical protein [Mycolicibacterium sp. S3B2]